MRIVSLSLFALLVCYVIADCQVPVDVFSLTETVSVRSDVTLGTVAGTVKTVFGISSETPNDPLTMMPHVSARPRGNIVIVAPGLELSSVTSRMDVSWGKLLVASKDVPAMSSDFTQQLLVDEHSRRFLPQEFAEVFGKSSVLLGDGVSTVVNSASSLPSRCEISIVEMKDDGLSFCVGNDDTCVELSHEDRRGNGLLEDVALLETVGALVQSKYSERNEPILMVVEMKNIDSYKDSDLHLKVARSAIEAFVEHVGKVLDGRVVGQIASSAAFHDYFPEKSINPRVVAGSDGPPAKKKVTMDEVYSWQLGLWTSAILVIVIAFAAWAIGGMDYMKDSLLFRFNTSIR